MKIKIQLTIVLLSITILSCLNKKNSNDVKLFHTTWELVYINETQSSFDSLYPKKKPQITFNKDTQKVEGNNSCNGYSADFKLSGNSIWFGEPGPTTMMYCGEGEHVFLDMMKRIDNYTIDNSALILMVGEDEMLRFKETN